MQASKTTTHHRARALGDYTRTGLSGITMGSLRAIWPCKKSLGARRAAVNTR